MSVPLLLPLKKGLHFFHTKTLKMPCAVNHKVSKLWPIAYSNGLRQDGTTTVLASSLTDANGNFFIPLVSVKGDVRSVVSTPTSPTTHKCPVMGRAFW